MDEKQGLPVAGYKPTQSLAAIDAVNIFKQHEERVLRHIEFLDREAALWSAKRDGIKADEPTVPVDPRLLAIGRTQLQGAFMFLARAVFQPGRVNLPEDAPYEHEPAPNMTALMEADGDHDQGAQ